MKILVSVAVLLVLAIGGSIAYLNAADVAIPQTQISKDIPLAGAKN